MYINDLCDRLVIGTDYLKVFATDLRDVIDDTDNMCERMVCLDNYDRHMKRLQRIRDSIELAIKEA